MDKLAIEQLKNRLDELKRDYTKEAKSAFKTGVLEIFKTLPTIHAVTWRQYTPYFNDGDACVFGTDFYEPDLYIDVEAYGGEDKLPVDYEDIDNGIAHYVGRGSLPAEFESVADEIVNFLEAFDDDVYLELFGDHVAVTLYRDGSTEVEEYDHG